MINIGGTFCAAAFSIGRGIAMTVICVLALLWASVMTVLYIGSAVIYAV